MWDLRTIKAIQAENRAEVRNRRLLRLVEQAEKARGRLHRHP